MSDWVIKGLIFVLAVDIILFMGQIATQEIASQIGLEFNMSYMNYESSNIAQMDSGDYTLDTSNLDTRILGTLATGVNVDTGTIFTDPIATMNNWLVSNIPGVKYALMLVAAPYNFVRALGVPDWFSFSIGGMWMALTILLIVLLIVGRN